MYVLLQIYDNHYITDQNSVLKLTQNVKFIKNKHIDLNLINDYGGNNDKIKISSYIKIIPNENLIEIRNESNNIKYYTHGKKKVLRPLEINKIKKCRLMTGWLKNNLDRENELLKNGLLVDLNIDNIYKAANIIRKNYLYIHGDIIIDFLKWKIITF